MVDISRSLLMVVLRTYHGAYHATYRGDYRPNYLVLDNLDLPPVCFVRVGPHGSSVKHGEGNDGFI